MIQQQILSIGQPGLFYDIGGKVFKLIMKLNGRYES